MMQFGRTLQHATPIFLGVFLLCSSLAHAQSQAVTGESSVEQQSVAPDRSPKPFIVATREAPPFAIKGPDGQWQGLSIWLWGEVARSIGVTTEFKEASLADMIDGVADGRYDASIAALTITPEREATIDFSHPFYTTGFGIAVKQGSANWISILFAIFTWGFIQAIAALLAVLAGIGVLFWLAERKQNPEQFGGPPLKGIGSGLWFSAVTMTTVGYGDKAPMTRIGRIIALIWMFAAILIISTFTGMIASALTSERLTGMVEGPSDLGKVVVGSIQGSSSQDWLNTERVNFTNFKSVSDGLNALESGAIGAFVYDKPLLQYRIKQHHEATLTVLAGTYGRQDYGIALPYGSPLREAVNQALLETIDGEEWTDRVVAEVGETQ